MSAAVAVQALVAGLATGAAYGLIALGFTLVHRLTGVIAFAHGDIVVGAVFVAVLAVVGTTPVASTLSVLGSVGLLVVAVVAGGVLSVVVYVLAVRPFRASAVGRRGDVVGWAAGGLAAGLLIRELTGLPFRSRPMRCRTRSAVRACCPSAAGSRCRCVASKCFSSASSWGWRSSACWPSPGPARWCARCRRTRGAAALLGIPCERVVLAAFALAGALAGLAGVLIAPDAALGPEDGALLGLKGITAALIGGLVSLRLALLGGLALGVFEAFVVAWEPLGGRWGDMPLAARPAGDRPGGSAR